MIARASSGSRSRISSVDPLMSANNAVTVLRSPSAAAEASICPAEIRIASALPTGAGGSAAVLVGVSAAPQSPQKLLPDGLTTPHFGQRFASGVPQSPQNFFPSAFSLP